MIQSGLSAETLLDSRNLMAPKRVTFNARPHSFALRGIFARDSKRSLSRRGAIGERDADCKSGPSASQRFRKWSIDQFP